MKDLLDEFKAFVMRGNVLDLAVAVILGIAFGAVVVSFTNDIIMAIIGAIFGKPNFSNLTLDIGDGVVRYGAFLTAVLNFLIVAAALFAVVKMIAAVQRPAPEETATPSDEAVLHTEIRDILASGQD